MNEYSWVPVIVELFLSEPVFQSFCWGTLGAVWLFGIAAIVKAIKS